MKFGRPGSHKAKLESHAPQDGGSQLIIAIPGERKRRGDHRLGFGIYGQSRLWSGG